MLAALDIGWGWDPRCGRSCAATGEAALEAPDCPLGTRHAAHAVTKATRLVLV